MEHPSFFSSLGEAVVKPVGCICRLGHIHRFPQLDNQKMNITSNVRYQRSYMAVTYPIPYLSLSSIIICCTRCCRMIHLPCMNILNWAGFI